MQPLPTELTSGPFSVRRARGLGVTPDVLRAARLHMPFTGVRLPPDSPRDVATRCAALALIINDRAAFSHHTALRLYGLPPGATRRPRVAAESGDDVLDVSVPRGVSVPAGKGVRGHDALWDVADVVVVRGLRVTSPERTLCDLATSCTRNDLTVIADAMLSGPFRRAPLTCPDALELRVQAWAGRRGAVVLREAIRLASTGVDSPMETLLRLLLLDAGLPRPSVNEPIYDTWGTTIHRPDLSWPQWRVAVEYDGSHHFETRGPDPTWRRRHDVARVELMQELGWIVRVMTSHDVLNSPDNATRRVRAALHERGAPLA